MEGGFKPRMSYPSLCHREPPFLRRGGLLNKKEIASPLKNAPSNDTQRAWHINLYPWREHPNVGIACYSSPPDATPIILNRLKSLEYPWRDEARLAEPQNHTIFT